MIDEKMAIACLLDIKKRIGNDKLGVNLDFLIATLEEMKTIETNWVLCIDRQPPKPIHSERYLVTLQNRHIDNSKCMVDIADYQNCDDFCEWDHGWGDDVEVIAWMALPPAYQKPMYRIIVNEQDYLNNILERMNKNADK